MSDEQTLWKGSPSQWLNIWHFLAAILVDIGIFCGGLAFPPVWFGLIFAPVYMLWRYLLVRTQVFELTTERLRITKGVINQRIDEVELYRVKDHLMVRPFWMRITGLGTIELETSDRTLPQLTIPAVPGGVELRELIRRQVELIRDKKRVREMDLEETVMDDADHHHM